MEDPAYASPERITYIRDSIVTAAAVVLAFLALDDITTDTTTSNFIPERLALAACAIWFLTVTRRLWRQGRRTLAGISFALLGLAALAQPFIGRKSAPADSWLPYIASVAGLAWFLVMAGMLTALAWRRLPVLGGPIHSPEDRQH